MTDLYISILHHADEDPPGDDPYSVKIVGVFSTRDSALKCLKDYLERERKREEECEGYYFDPLTYYIAKSKLDDHCDFSSWCCSGIENAEQVFT